MTKAGYTLIEILVTLSLIAILIGIATISYNNYVVSMTRKDMHNHGKVFVLSVQNCIAGAGGWTINRRDAANRNFKIPENPCDVSDPDPDEVKKNLKTKLNFDCPFKSDDPGVGANADCLAEFISNTKHYCLSIQREIKGKKHQVFVNINPNNTSDYKIYCGEITGNQDNGNPYPYRKPRINTCKANNIEVASIKKFLKEPCKW